MQLTKKNRLAKLIALIFVIIVICFLLRQIYKPNNYIDPNLPLFTQESIKEFNGLNLDKPVYIVYEGLVYDVSSSREKFYNQDKTYNYLAGKDSTKELNIAGGAIIKSKYKIVGRFIKN